MSRAKSQIQNMDNGQLNNMANMIKNMDKETFKNMIIEINVQVIHKYNPWLIYNFF
jgi:hypothetical protein